MKIGILGFQGAFIEHIEMLNEMNIENTIVRDKDDLDHINGLIIPGGESSTIRKFIYCNPSFRSKLIKFIHKDKKPVLGTCAGLIVLSNTVDNSQNTLIGGLDICVMRNYFGPQINSSIKDTIFLPNNLKKKQIFIRAPYISTVKKEVDIICKSDKNLITGVKQGNIIGLSFHPELSKDRDIYLYFFNLIH